jgi:uncharacterized protein (TIGR00255 family)
MITSMTGFAAGRGVGAAHNWTWELRSVNGKGLDIRLRVPDWIDGLEAGLKADLQRAISRGNVSLGLKVMRDGLGENNEALRVNTPALQAVLEALSQIEAAAMASGVTLARATSADVLGVRGVLDTSAPDADTGPLHSAIIADFAGVLAEFSTMRRAEGEALFGVIEAQLDQIGALVRLAGAEVTVRRDSQATLLKDALGRVLAASDGLDETRLAQELALIAVKTDVQEELDRLGAHVSAARALLIEGGPVGRKLDFLMQEFMREANTLCSKAQSLALTRIGLDLKTVIDQMREQVQNVE